MTSKFEVTKWFPEEVYWAICAVRASGQVHSIVRKQARKRKRRTEFIQNESGNIALLACDHPARMVVDPGNDSLAMGDRYELLGRILRVLVVKEWDGVMVTPDLFEDLMILRHILIERGQEDFAEVLFDNRVFIGSMNRGGLAGSVFELDDRFTAFTHTGITQNNLDGAKMMFRLDLTNRDSLETIEACARVISQFSRKRTAIFLECFQVEWGDESGKLESLKDADSLIKAISVAQALGDPARNLWLKLPYCEDFERVARATTCPVVLLGGSTKNEEDLQSFFEDMHKGLASGSNVRGVMVGRNVLFPPGHRDPYAFARAISTFVHHRDMFSPEEALDMLERFSKEEVREDFSKIT